MDELLWCWFLIIYGLACSELLLNLLLVTEVPKKWGERGIFMRENLGNSEKNFGAVQTGPWDLWMWPSQDLDIIEIFDPMGLINDSLSLICDGPGL